MQNNVISMKNSTYPKEYRTSSYWLLFPLWILACLVVAWNMYKLGGLVIKDPWFWLLAAFEVPLQLSVLIFMYHMIQDVRLRISESGLTFSMWSREMYVDWHQVKRIDYLYFQQQLVIDKPLVEKRKAWWLWLDFHKLRSDDSFKSIPFSKWAWEKFDEVEAEVKKHLPHLEE